MTAKSILCPFPELNMTSPTSHGRQQLVGSVTLLFTDTACKKWSFPPKLNSKMLQIFSCKTFKFTIHTPNQVSKWKWKLLCYFVKRKTCKCLANVKGKWYIFSHRCSIVNVRSDREMSCSSRFEVNGCSFLYFRHISSKLLELKNSHRNF